MTAAAIDDRSADGDDARPSQQQQQQQQHSSVGGDESEDVGSSSFDQEDSETRSTTSGHEEGVARRRNSYDDLNEHQITGLNFVMEHRIFLNAILGLLTDRDKNATQIGMNDPNVLKCGPLKKASHLVSGVWKQKYCEVRRGMFSYYEDARSDNKVQEGLQRKNVPLEYGACACRAVKIHRKGLNITPGGAIFEIKLGNTRRLWLARSRAERQAWIQAIQSAIVGGSVTRNNNEPASGHKGLLGGVNSRSPYKQDLKLYQKIKSAVKTAGTKKEYLAVLGELRGGCLDIPVQWMMAQTERAGSAPTSIFYEDSMDGGVEQLRKDLRRDTLKINDDLYEGDSGHASEKIIAGLARNILEISKTSDYPRKLAIPESKAFMFARDVLLSSNRTRSGGDSYFCVDTLVNNPNLVVTVPSSREAEPVSITVEIDEDDSPINFGHSSKSGWARTRHNLQKSWRKRYFVLAEGTLSIYMNATPRPHGLRGQLVIADSSIAVDRYKDDPNQLVITITSKDGLKIRTMRFQDQVRMISWVYALECAARRPSSIANSTIGQLRRRLSPNKTSQATKTDGAVRWSTVIEDAVKVHAKKISLDSTTVDQQLTGLTLQATVAIKLCVRASTEYNVCTTDPQGDDGDTWATISSTFLQTFCIREGKLDRGEEIVRLVVSKCADPMNFADALGDEGSAPATAGGGTGTTRLFKRASNT